MIFVFLLRLVDSERRVHAYASLKEDSQSMLQLSSLGLFQSAATNDCTVDEQMDGVIIIHECPSASRNEFLICLRPHCVDSECFQLSCVDGFV